MKNQTKEKSLKMDKEEIEFRENLIKLNKLELVEYIFNYWCGLKAECGDNDWFIYKEGVQPERIKITQVNNMVNLLIIKSSGK